MTEEDIYLILLEFQRETLVFGTYPEDNVAITKKYAAILKDKIDHEN
jgi:hypothetical protein